MEDSNDDRTPSAEEEEEENEETEEDDGDRTDSDGGTDGAADDDDDDANDDDRGEDDNDDDGDDEGGGEGTKMVMDPDPDIIGGDTESEENEDGGGEGRQRRDKRPTARVTTSSRSSKKRSRHALPVPTEPSPALSASAAVPSSSTSAAAAVVLPPGTTPVPPGTLPSVEQVRAAAVKSVSDNPPFVHLSGRDSAPQLKIDDSFPDGRRLTLGGGMRGYRMARATHGPSVGEYYYEVEVLRPPSVREVVGSLPGNVRLGRGLKRSLQEGLVAEEKLALSAGRAAATTTTSGGLDSGGNNGNFDDEQSEAYKPKSKKRRTLAGKEESAALSRTVASAGGHVRVGWSMRTGDLQAPVGYDRWSYGLRDVLGSRVHRSRREDRWGGEGFGPGDVVGFGICLVGRDKDKEDDERHGEPGDDEPPAAPLPTATSAGRPIGNHIRFFKNGEAMGHFVVSRGVRSGGAAFENVSDGTYYPAVSVYMGASVRVNFGPLFVYPPRMLPSGMKLKPVSDLCQPPPSPDDAVEKALKERNFPKKTEENIVQAFADVIRAEAEIRHDAYTTHMLHHVEEVRKGRESRGLSTGDLPSKPPPAEVGEGEEGGD